MDSFPVRFLERFEVLEAIPSRRGTVHKVCEKALGRVAVAKFLAPDQAADAAARRRFLDEGRLLARLKHPAMVEVYDVEDCPDGAWIVMEFVDGFSLKDEVARMGKVPLRHACGYMIQLAEGLSYVHREGLLHRNVKPKNILIDRFGVVKILDFGFALATGGSAVAGGEGRVLGTPAYMAPEQATGGALDGRTDVYAAGVVFFEMLCGTAPFWGETPKEIMKAHVEEEPPSVREFNPLVPREVRRIVRRMLAKNLDERYDKMEKVARDLKIFLDGDWEAEVEKIRSELAAAGTVVEVSAEAAREKLKRRAGRRQVAREDRRRRRRRRRVVEGIRTALVVVALAASLGVAAFGLDRMGAFSRVAAWLGEQPSDVTFRQVGRTVEVRWRTAAAGPSAVRVLEPFAGRVYEDRVRRETGDHAVRLADIPDGASLRLRVVMPGGYDSGEFDHVVRHVRMVDDLTVRPGITDATVTLRTRQAVRSAVVVRPADAAPGREWAVESARSGELHHMAVSGLPSASAYVVTASVRWSDPVSGATAADEFWEDAQATFTTLEPSYRRIWGTPQGDVIQPSPVVAGDLVLVASDDGNLRGVAERSGELRWTARVGGVVTGTPLVVAGRAWCVGRDGSLVAVEAATGRLLARADVGGPVRGGPCQAGDGVVVVTEAGLVRCVGPDGTLRWSRDLAVNVEAPPWCDGERVFVGDVGGVVRALRADRGGELWRFQTGNKLQAATVAGPRGILVPGMDGFLYGLGRDTGQVSWRKEAGSFPGGITVARAATRGGGPVREFLFGAATQSEGSVLFCADAGTGAGIWTAEVPAEVPGPPAVTEGRVYLGGSDGNVYCHDAATGLRLWVVGTGSELRGGVAAGAGAVFAATYRGDLFRIED